MMPAIRPKELRLIDARVSSARLQVICSEPVGAVMALEKELETYEAKLEELLANEGGFVLIHGEKVLGVYAAYEDALRAGYEKLGVKPFLVKRIAASESLHYFTRDIMGECHT